MVGEATIARSSPESRVARLVPYGLRHYHAANLAAFGADRPSGNPSASIDELGDDSAPHQGSSRCLTSSLSGEQKCAASCESRLEARVRQFAFCEHAHCRYFHPRRLLLCLQTQLDCQFGKAWYASNTGEPQSSHL